jgi:hypothetical protein
MTPQFNFMVAAPVAPEQVSGLRELLLSMNVEGGGADPRNPIVPFGDFPRLHFARILIVEDRTEGDLAAFNLPPPDYPIYLVLLGEYDGPREDMLEHLAARAPGGLRQLLSHCSDFSPQVDLLAWMKEHSRRPAAMYVNTRGRTMQQVREESALRETLLSYLLGNAAAMRTMPAQLVYQTLKGVAEKQLQERRLTLTPEQPTPLGWRIRNFAHLLGVPFLLLLLTPFLLLYAPIFIWQLRHRETSDPEIAPRIDLEHADKLASIEDRDVTNQFSAFGSIKPGAFRRGILVFLLWVIDYTTRHIYTRGRLARVSTIHFARWVFLDGKKRLLFASNYDGSLEAYMDDFINKVSFGLNVVFSNGIGYPTTNWLVADGAKDEQKFKYYIRRHQLPTEVWYNAHRGLTALEMQRNARIRQGIERDSMTDAEAEAWVKLF